MSGTATIVVVDDAPELRALATAQLRLSGRFTVVGTGATGLDAISLAREHRPDVVLLDIAMPELNGFDAIPRIREVSPETKVVIYTGLVERGLAERGIELGAVGQIEKTAPIEELAADVANAVESPAVAREAAGHVSDEALRQSESKFRLLVEGATDYAIFMLDPEGYISTWNLGAQRIKGYAAAEALGRHFRMFYPPEAQQSGHPEYELEMARRDGRYEEEGWRLRKDGSRFWASVTITAIRSAAGELIGFGKVTRDSTERRELQRERERAAAELSAANSELAAANARLAAANLQLASAAEDKTQFLAVTAHELRTPIRVVAGAGETLSEHWTELTDSERADLLESMRTSGGRMRRLLDDLLTAARLESGAIQIRAERTLVRPVVLGAVTQTTAAYSSDQIAVECRPDITVTADPSRLEQIVANYLTNAARYGEPPIQVAVTANGGDVVIEVTDHGPGVPAELEQRLFDKFTRATQDRGTGLGLFIARQLARAQGGDTWYERRNGQSRFALRLSTAD